MTKDISEAEWEIMRIVWTQSPVTSTVIIKELEGIKGWMPTTVKTLLSRLVNKEIIRFETKGRTFYYSPIVTEEQCIRNEMRNVVEKVYGGTINHETSHFYFKGHSDEVFIKQLAIELESKYSKITSDLNYINSEKVLIYQHNSQRRLHSALGLLEGPKWLRAGHLWNIIHVAPAICFDDLSAEKAVVHTFTQLLIEQINPMAPYWLQQAVAAYESKWLSEEKITEAIMADEFKLSQSKSKETIQLQNLREDFLTFKEMNGYELGYTVIEYVDITFGIGKIAAWVRKPNDYLEIFGLEENQFWNDWRKFLKLR